MASNRLLILVSGLGCLFAAAAQATLVIPTYSTTYDGITNLNDITLTLASSTPFPTSPSTITVEDIRGTSAVLNTSPSSLDYLSSGANPVPNSLLLGLNNNFSQEVLISFSLASSALTFPTPFYTGGVIAAAAGIPVGTVTDPSLTAFLGLNYFEFTYEPNSSSPGKGVLSYGLDGIIPAVATPEPASPTLLVVSAIALYLEKKRRRTLP